MSKSSEVVGGGTSVAAATPKVSAAPVEEGGGGTLLEDAPRETEGSASNEQPSDEGKWHLEDQQHGQAH